MIDRIVLFKLRSEHATPEGRRAAADEGRPAIEGAPGVQSVTIGVPADEAAARSWDLSLIVRLDDLDALPAYQAHPPHRRWVDEYMAPRVEVRKAWNFEV